MNPHQHLQILASALTHKTSHLSTTTPRDVIKSLAIKTPLTAETNSILTSYNAFFVSYTAKNPPSFGHIISLEELCEAYAKYHYQLLFEHISSPSKPDLPRSYP